MNARTFLIISLVAIVSIGVGISLLGYYLRMKDFQDQISGKKEIRKEPKDKEISFKNENKGNFSIDIDREILKTKSGQNLTGPR